MNDEIKEILDRLEKIGFYASVPKELAYITTNITPQECKQLLDYITNLQEENKGYEQGLEKSFKTIHDLQKVIKKQERELKKYDRKSGAK